MLFNFKKEKKSEIKIREYCCLRTRIPTHGDMKHERGGNLITLPALEAGSPRLALPGSMISLQMRDSILTTRMTSGQLLNDSAAGNAIHHLQLTFISSPPYTEAQPVLFTVTARSSPATPPPPFFEPSLPDTIHTALSSQVHSCENNHFTSISQIYWLKIICARDLLVPVYSHKEVWVSCLVICDGLLRLKATWSTR